MSSNFSERAWQQKKKEALAWEIIKLFNSLEKIPIFVLSYETKLFFFLSCSTSGYEVWCRTEVAVVKSAMEVLLCGGVEFLADKRIWRKSFWIMLLHDKKVITVVEIVEDLAKAVT